jgi:hypothetical protein
MQQIISFIISNASKLPSQFCKGYLDVLNIPFANYFEQLDSFGAQQVFACDPLDFARLGNHLAVLQRGLFPFELVN